MAYPIISVIIATKNEERNIERIINSIKKQKYPVKKIEIIFVDNGSTDKTIEILKKQKVKYYQLQKERSLSGIKNFRGAQVNFGVEKSTGQIIFFPDADMTFASLLLKEAAEKISREKCDALYIPEVVCGKGYFGMIRNFERSFYNETCVDGVRIIRKDLFLKIGGFDVDNVVFGYDDWDITKTLIKSGARVDITKTCLFHHEEWLDIKTYLRKKSKYAIDTGDYIKKWGEYEKDVKKQFGLYYRFFGVFMEKGKWKKIITHPFLSSGMYFLRLLVGVQYLIRKK